jgi:hypothetical protein
MANEDFHIGNAGSILHLTFKKKGVAFDISSSTVKKILIKKKDGNVLEKDAVFEPVPLGTGTGSDGKVCYTFTGADLDVAGEWKAQGFVRFDTDHQVYSSVVTFTVEANLAAVA